MDDTAEDKTAIQPVINQIVAYPLKDFDGKMKSKDWSKAPAIPAPEIGRRRRNGMGRTGKILRPARRGARYRPPLPGEEALYGQFRAVLDAAAKDPAIKKALVQAAVETEEKSSSRSSSGNTTDVPPAMAGTARPTMRSWAPTTSTAPAPPSRTCSTTSRPRRNISTPTTTAASAALDGRNSYEITFAPGQEPPVNGFWSLTLYNEHHFFHPNDLKRYSLGTKNKNLKRNADGSLTLYAGAKSPGKDRESNWLPAPNGHFSLYIRAYWGKRRSSMARGSRRRS